METTYSNDSINIVGYGSQAKAWASNLRDQGYLVNVILPANSASHAMATHNGFFTSVLEDGFFNCSTTALLIPDHVQSDWLANYQDLLPPKSTLVFAHGYAITFDKPQLRSDIDVVLLSPKIIGPKLREHFINAKKASFAVGVWQSGSGDAWKRVQKLARDVGGAKTNMIYSTFKEETLANLFFEQTLFCGGIPAMIKSVMETMIDQGINPDLAREECITEIRLLMEMIETYGIDGMLKRVSPIARLGGSRAARFLIDQNFNAKLKVLFESVEDGSFDVYVKEKLLHRPSAAAQQIQL